jgi:hypothetical protein
MEPLMHQRIRTVHDGIRATKHSLATRVTCHASQKRSRVTGAGGVPPTCPSDAGTSLDCFECRADRLAATAAGARR